MKTKSYLNKKIENYDIIDFSTHLHDFVVSIEKSKLYDYFAVSNIIPEGLDILKALFDKFKTDLSINDYINYSKLAYYSNKVINNK